MKKLIFLSGLVVMMTGCSLNDRAYKPAWVQSQPGSNAACYKVVVTTAGSNTEMTSCESLEQATKDADLLNKVWEGKWPK